MALRLRKIKTGAGGERSVQPISARCFRRSAGRDVSDSPFRNRDGRCGMALVGAVDEISRIELASTGQWDLGSARGPKTFHPFKNDGLAGVRSRGQAGRNMQLRSRK